MNINQIVAGLTANANQQAASAAAAQQGYNLGTEQILALQSTTEAQGRQLAQSAEQTGMDMAAINYAINSGREKNAAIAGMDSQDQNNLYVQSIAQITEARAARDAARAEYDKLNSIGFLDNPIGYIFAQLQLPQVATRHNAALNKEATARSDFRNTVADITAKDSQIAANTASALRSVEEQKAKAAGIQAQMQLSKLQMDNISTIGQRTIQALQIGTVGFQAAKDALNVQMDAEKFKLQQESVAMQRAQVYEAQQEKLKQKGMEAEAAAERDQRELAASALLGYQGKINTKNLGVKERAQYEKIVQTLQLGNNPYEALQLIQTLGNKQVMLATNGGLSSMVNGTSDAIRKEAAEYTRANKLKTVKPGEAETAGADKWQAEVSNSGSSMAATYPVTASHWDSRFNPYKPMYLAVVDAAKAGAIPALKDNSAIAIIDAIPRDPSAGNLTGKQLETVVQTMAQRIANGTLGVDKAAQDLVALNKVGATMNREQLGYELMGLPPQQRLIMSVPGLAAFSDSQQLDGMDLASTKLALAKMAVQSNAAKNFGQAAQWLVPQRMGGGADVLAIGAQVAAEKLAPKK
jgi:hypothetical protein